MVLREIQRQRGDLKIDISGVGEAGERCADVRQTGIQWLLA